MTSIVNQIIEEQLNQSATHVTPEVYCFVSEPELANKSRETRRNSRSIALRGKKGPGIETAYFYNNAWMLGLTALEMEGETGDPCVAVLFRDSDGTRSASPGLFDRKRESIRSGFNRANFPRGVAMVPRPKSEAWLLCSAQTHPHQNCAKFETLSGNDNSPNSAKSQLHAALDGATSAAELVSWLAGPAVDIKQWHDMPSFQLFREELVSAIQKIIRPAEAA